MKTLLLGATLALGLLAGSSLPGHAAAGDGLDRNAAATGNSTFAGQHRTARMGSMTARRPMMRRHRRHR
ncbi:hypothetical protein MKK70_15975 [Methylobacterium sp. E-041]|jgi:hypothetical protein|uniref:hypothetical protein n=1 Tax=unclassified Methylobacterium TaxID=2615210 RepID=UPI0011C877AF|nr:MULTISPECIES: hypothetical protein [unclassified Methylobacterium]RZK88702.1 MAG: hypothetical protein EOO66_17550 [Methylobacterium sp.]MCJ2007767.1 hypothetical protein [Methylobacterium sp. J-092]MCJ2078078.1 hypothetical protein [Methylobacterium sp. E-016]MCJ2106846.1 hypothetical protein [Methylobacterium sp. E-041]TXN71992.1 hypothetical protein FV230_06575 [Methylobacterium sp. WL6]